MISQVEELFDRCIEEARAGRDPEVTLREHPEAAKEVRPLLALAGEMARLPAPPPSEVSLAKVFAHLAAELAPPAADTLKQELERGTPVNEEDPRVPRPSSYLGVRGGASGKTNDAAPASPAPVRPRKRFLSLRVAGWAAAAVFLILLAGWGMVSASAGALPGDWLYPIKRFTERATYVLTVGPDHRAELRIRFADQRLEEVVRMHRQGSGIDAQLLRAMLDEAIRAFDATDQLPEASRNLVMERATCSCQFRCRMLSELDRTASAEERKALQPFINACGAG